MNFNSNMSSSSDDTYEDDPIYWYIRNNFKPPRIQPEKSDSNSNEQATLNVLQELSIMEEQVQNYHFKNKSGASKDIKRTSLSLKKAVENELKTNLKRIWLNYEYQLSLATQLIEKSQITSTSTYDST